MPDLLQAANHWDPQQYQSKAIIETPKGRRNKFDYDPEYQLFELGGMLPEGFSFPYDFGFIPSTLAEDGDPIDIMILMDEPAHVGCLVTVRLIGVIEAEQEEDGKRTSNHRLIGVVGPFYSHRELRSIEELPPSLLDQVEAFFTAYNQIRGKKFRATGRRGPERAAELLEGAIQTFKNKQARAK